MPKGPDSVGQAAVLSGMEGPLGINAVGKGSLRRAERGRGGAGPEAVERGCRLVGQVDAVGLESGRAGRTPATALTDG